MKVAILGAGGQLGRALVARFSEQGWQVAAWTHAELDLIDGAAVRRALFMARPDAVVNAAAMTAVDAAEDRAWLAFAVNADGAMHAAEAAAELGAMFVQVSTDYVFGGEKRAPYREGDRVNPRNVYGASKRAGERAVMSVHPGACIVRTSWLFAPWGKNFFTTMARLLQTQPQVRVVDDQLGKPTSCAMLAEGIAALITQEATGVWHLAQPPAVSWYRFAENIAARMREAGMPVRAKLVPIPTSAYPTPAVRPPYSVLDCTKIEALIALRSWEEDLEQAIDWLARA